MMKSANTIKVDGREVAFTDQRNLLEVIRSANIEIPTFCYHSELSVYGACRLCLVEVEGRGLMASCSIKAEPGMVVRTNTEEIRQMRKMTLELLLAGHKQECPTCTRSGSCELQKLARKFGIDKVRFRSVPKSAPLDQSSSSLIRDPNKCVLCGDCVRYCKEVQGIGAIDFVNRGSQTVIAPAFLKGLGEVECINCGQCAAVCPTGAIIPNPQINNVWKAIHDPKKVVVAQVAPAVRVAIGEEFGLKAGEVATGKLIAAMKLAGFDKVYDTSFTADLTVIEEANEFIGRLKNNEHLPQFTSCCPGWVKFAEQYYPDLLGNLSSCKSPQQMFGSVARDTLPKLLHVEPENLVIVSVMPCTAKKFEAKQEKFARDGRPDVDFVLTTQELAQMISEAGIAFTELQPESLDMPLGFKTGAGVIFGVSGGVTEAVLRYAAEKVTGTILENPDFNFVRGEGGLREAAVKLNGQELRIAIVHGLRRARQICDQVRSGTCQYHIIEVMACPGGCVSGAGQPIDRHGSTRSARSRGLYDADKMLQLHKAQENHYVQELYDKNLGAIGGHKAHTLLHTHYHSKPRIQDVNLDFSTPSGQTEKLDVKVCVGTNCYVRGSQNLLNQLIRYIDEAGLSSRVNVRGTFCLQNCDHGPNVMVGTRLVDHCTFESVCEALQQELDKVIV